MRKIGGLQEDVLLTGGLIAGGYLLLKNILPDFLPNLGISDEDRSILDNQQTQDGTSNIFSINYPAYSDWFLQNIIERYPEFNAGDNTTFWNNVYYAYVHGQLSPTDKLYSIIQIFEGINKALIGHIYSGDQEALNFYLDQITNKWQVAALNDIFSSVVHGYLFGADLYHTLRYGWFTEVYGLNGTDLARQITRLNNLPD